jgi:hypothetical protein
MSQERTAEDWGRVAVSLPDFSWAGCDAWYAPRGSQGRRWDLEAGVAIKVHVLRHGAIGYPDAVRCVPADGEALPSGLTVFDCEAGDLVLRDTPATAGCLLALLAPRGVYIVPCDQRKGWWRAIIPAGAWPESAPTLGRACIAAAEALGRWPGGES